jgi:hypothetical protein
MDHRIVEKLKGVVPEAASAVPPSEDEIDKLLNIAPKYGIEVKLPPH